MKWLQTLPTTNARIAVTIAIAVATAVRYLSAGVPGGSDNGWNAWLVFVAVMAGIDVSQYIGKRFTDTGLAAAKAAGPSPVTVEAPSTVVAQQQSPGGPS